MVHNEAHLCALDCFTDTLDTGERLIRIIFTSRRLFRAAPWFILSRCPRGVQFRTVRGATAERTSFTLVGDSGSFEIFEVRYTALNKYQQKF
ncbi:hypothetical protein GQ600_1373 [Phytophthora cactorum]|nr:hypothetical protein GQ600_1373 [Phytophthora cactorum]